MRNLALEYLERQGADIYDYDGNCLELVDELLHTVPDRHTRILHIEEQDMGVFGSVYPDLLDWDEWGWHAVLEIDGWVHDAWWPCPLPLDDYLQQMFPGQLLWVECVPQSWGKKFDTRSPDEIAASTG